MYESVMQLVMRKDFIFFSTVIRRELKATDDDETLIQKIIH